MLPITRDEAERAFSSESPDLTINALGRLAFHDADWRWVQDKCLYFIDTQREDVRAVAITCLGHLARMHGRLDLEKVMPVLASLLDDLQLGGRAEDALEDIEIFIHKRETL